MRVDTSREPDFRIEVQRRAVSVVKRGHCTDWQMRPSTSAAQQRIMGEAWPRDEVTRRVEICLSSSIPGAPVDLEGGGDGDEGDVAEVGNGGGSSEDGVVEERFLVFRRVRIARRMAQKMLMRTASRRAYLVTLRHSTK